MLKRQDKNGSISLFSSPNTIYNLYYIMAVHHYYKKYRIRPNYRTVPLAFFKVIGEKTCSEIYLIKVHVEERSAENCLFNDAYAICF